MADLDCFHCDGLVARRWDPSHGGEIVCRPGRLDERRLVDDPRTDFAEAAARCELHEVMSKRAIAIRSDALLADLVRIFVEQDVRAIAVVDEQNRLVGLASRSIALAGHARVSDVMSPCTHALSERAPISHAMATMAFEDVDFVPVVAASGELVGQVHALDTLRWIAKRMGYVDASAAVDE
jgi:predicted transcriptional regulator